MTTRQEIIKANIAFMYGRDEEAAKHDPDKRSFVRTKKIEDDSLSGFVGDYHFLATDYPCEVLLKGCPSPFPSMEHALQASKSSSSEVHEQLRGISDTRELKRTTARIVKQEDMEKWHQKSEDIAEQLIRDKFFRNKSLCIKLMSTEHRPLVNKNDYQDKFWGVCNGTGQNKLGKLLEKIRLCNEQGKLQEVWLSDHFELEDVDKISISVTVKKDGIVISDYCQTEERKNVIEVGKSDDNDIVLGHPTTSRFHALLVVDRLQGLVLVDLRAANGTRVNGNVIKPLTPVTLENNTSVVQFGASSREYSFVLDNNADVKRDQSLYARLAADKNKQTSRNGGGKDSHTSPETTIFVGNLSYSSTEQEVKDFFSVCGEVTNVKIPRDRESGETRGIAFVTFDKIGGLYQALTRDGDELGDRELKIRRSEAKSKNNNGARSGGGKDKRNVSKDYSSKDDPGHYGPSSSSYRQSSRRDRSRSYSPDDRGRRDVRTRSRSRSRSQNDTKRHRKYSRRSRSDSSDSSSDYRNKRSSRRSRRQSRSKSRSSSR